MYLQDRRKTEGWNRAIYPTRLKLGNTPWLRGHVLPTTLRILLWRIRTVPSRNRPQEVSDITKNLAERGKQHLKIVQKRNQTKLNSGSTNAETTQASWPTVGPLQGGGTPYNSREMCHKITETLIDEGKNVKKIQVIPNQRANVPIIMYTNQGNSLHKWYATSICNNQKKKFAQPAQNKHCSIPWTITDHEGPESPSRGN